MRRAVRSDVRIYLIAAPCSVLSYTVNEWVAIVMYNATALKGILRLVSVILPNNNVFVNVLDDIDTTLSFNTSSPDDVLNEVLSILVCIGSPLFLSTLRHMKVKRHRREAYYFWMASQSLGGVFSRGGVRLLTEEMERGEGFLPFHLSTLHMYFFFPFQIILFQRTPFVHILLRWLSFSKFDKSVIIIKFDLKKSFKKTIFGQIFG